MKLMLAEDEKRMADALMELFRQEGYDADWFSDGVEAELAAKDGIYDVIILDVMLPGKDGMQIARDIRKDGVSTPVLMLTAKSELADKVQGLDSGADDYLTKPFSVIELLARIRALSRRGTAKVADVDEMHEGDIVLNKATHVLRNTGTDEDVRLSDKEFKILEYFMMNAGRIITREQLGLRVWGYDSDSEYNKVEVYITFTRKKLAFVGSKAQIKAVRGIGYEFISSGKED